MFGSNFCYWRNWLHGWLVVCLRTQMLPIKNVKRTRVSTSETFKSNMEARLLLYMYLYVCIQATVCRAVLLILAQCVFTQSKNFIRVEKKDYTLPEEFRAACEAFSNIKFMKSNFTPLTLKTQVLKPHLNFWSPLTFHTLHALKRTKIWVQSSCKKITEAIKFIIKASETLKVALQNHFWQKNMLNAVS